MLSIACRLSDVSPDIKVEAADRSISIRHLLANVVNSVLTEYPNEVPETQDSKLSSTNKTDELSWGFTLKKELYSFVSKCVPGGCDLWPYHGPTLNKHQIWSFYQGIIGLVTERFLRFSRCNNQSKIPKPHISAIWSKETEWSVHPENDKNWEEFRSLHCHG